MRAKLGGFEQELWRKRSKSYMGWRNGSILFKLQAKVKDLPDPRPKRQRTTLELIKKT
jgi:hypothetical protein